MQTSEIQYGTAPQGAWSRGAGQLPVLLFVAGFLLFFVFVPGKAGATVPEPPMQLPAAAGTSSSKPGQDSLNWIVGGTPGRKTTAVAAAAGASAIDRRTGSFRIGRQQARKLAKRLQAAGVLVYAEPDVPLTRSGYPDDRYIAEQWWLSRVVNPSDVTPPAVHANSPLIAVIEESLDPLHPDLVEANLSGAVSLGPDADTHGTSVASIIGSPGEGAGIRGVWPGARMKLFPSGGTCSSATRAVSRAVNQRAAVINMSYTFHAGQCYSHFQATQRAVKRGSIPVAAAGNSGAGSNAPARPAIDPHVLAVAALNDQYALSPFSTRNPGVDLATPGENLFAPVVGKGPGGPLDAVRGWGLVSGTSFSAPMVSAAAAWIRQVRPRLDNLQVGRLLMDSATELGPPGRDSSFGEGLLSIEASLTAPNPRRDPFEPNDDIRWINGSQIGGKAPFLWRPGKGRKRVLNATLSRAKDPADVYRVLLPARSRMMISLVQREGDVVLSAFKPKTRTITKKVRRNLIVRSDRAYPKTEGVVIRNRKRKHQAIWLAVTPSKRQAENDAAYRLRLIRR